MKNGPLVGGPLPLIPLGEDNSRPSRNTRIRHMFQSRYLKHRYLERGRGSALHGSAVALRPLRSGDLDLVADMGLEFVGITGELMFFTAAIGEHIVVLRVLQASLDRCHTGCFARVLRERTNRKTDDHQS
jgi:hypothetical protein